MADSKRDAVAPTAPRPRFRLLTHQDYIGPDGKVRHGRSGAVVDDIPPDTIQAYIKHKIIEPA